MVPALWGCSAGRAHRRRRAQRRGPDRWGRAWAQPGWTMGPWLGLQELMGP